MAGGMNRFVALDLGDVSRVDEHNHIDRIEHKSLRHDILVRKRFGDKACRRVVGP